VAEPPGEPILGGVSPNPAPLAGRLVISGDHFDAPVTSVALIR
jgi:hypothetical protein